MAVDSIAGFLLLFTVFVPVLVGYICYCIWSETIIKDFVGKKVLFVTAHPDDECMFFSPTILQLCRRCDVHLLCLSAGDYYGQGQIRKEELFASCSILGIPANNVTVIDSREMPDDPNRDWNNDTVREAILDYVTKFDIDAIITFDDYGVSGHINHIAIFNAVKTFVGKKTLERLPKQLPVYVLESVSLVRKYITILDLPNSIFSEYIFLSSIQDFISTQKAMAIHGSQYLWFRRLYVIFSRYMVVNSLERLYCCSQS